MSSPAITVQGQGAVTSAGWGVEPLVKAIQRKAVIPLEESQRDGSPVSTQTRPVPKPNAPLPFVRNPRLRRCSPVTRYAVAASLEALGEERTSLVQEGAYSLGIVFTFMNGCVNYSHRFYGEVLEDPSLASPILFPETVFNAPASHLAAMLGSRNPAYTMVGDSSQFLSGVELAISWLRQRKLDGVLVVGAEELDWLSTEAAGLFRKDTIVSEGAGAVLLEYGSDPGNAPQVERISPAFTYHQDRDRRTANSALVDCLMEAPSDLWITGGLRETRPSAIAPSDILGDPLGAALALQCVLASALLGEGLDSVTVLHSGGNQQAIGARLTRSNDQA